MKLIKKFVCKIFGHKVNYTTSEPKWRKDIIGGIAYHSGIQFTTWECTRCGLNSKDSKPFPPENEFKLSVDKRSWAYPYGTNLTVSNEVIKGKAQITNYNKEYFDKLFSELEKYKPRGIFITKVVQPKTGAVMLIHCSTCNKTTIDISPYAVCPNDGDAWKIELDKCNKDCKGSFSEIKYSYIQTPETKELMERMHSIKIEAI